MIEVEESPLTPENDDVRMLSLSTRALVRWSESESSLVMSSAATGRCEGEGEGVRTWMLRGPASTVTLYAGQDGGLVH